MEPDYDITLNSGEEGTCDDSKNHFLDSLGLGERMLLADEERKAREFDEDEGVVLSSLPDDSGFPSAESGPARGLAVSFSVTRHTARDGIEALSLSPDEVEPVSEPESPLPAASESAIGPTPAALDGDPSTPAEAVPESPDAELNLSCPECGGSLVLHRRHLGVEGACVWCHTPIIAAQSGRDGQVRVFPLFSGPPTRSPRSAPESGTDPEPVPPGSPMPPAADSPPTPAPALPVPQAIEGEPEAPLSLSAIAAGTEMPPTVETDHGESVVPLPAFDFLPTAPSGFSGVTAPQESPATSVEVPVIAEPSPPLDLDSLYGNLGFVPPPEETPQPSPGFAAAAPGAVAPPNTTPEESIHGFGAFLQDRIAPSEEVPAGGFSAPVPWGPPTKPAVAPALASAKATPADVDAPPEWLPPGISSGFAPPAPLAAPSWASAFGATEMESPKPAMEEPAAGLSDFDDERFASGFGSGFTTGSAPDPVATNDVFSFDTPEDEAPGSFTAPIPAFEVRPSSPRTPEPFGFGETPDSHSWGSPAGTSDAAPATVEALDTALPEPIFDAPTSGTGSLFGEPQPLPKDSPFAVFHDAPVPAAPAMVEPAGREPDDHPHLVSQPLGTKPKPVVRKSFIVLMVTILGFASGAALASFVLPVDRYVAAAKSYLEQKLAPAPVAPELTPVPEAPPGVAAANAPANLNP